MTEDELNEAIKESIRGIAERYVDEMKEESPTLTDR